MLEMCALLMSEMWWKKRTKADRCFIMFSTLVMALICIIVIYPLLFVVSSSVNGGKMYGSVSLIPQRLSISGYSAIVQHRLIFTSYLNTVIYTVIGCVISLSITILCAYPLSRRELWCGKYFIYFYTATMFFSGGLIPSYLVVKSLGILNSMWAIVLPSAMSVPNMFMMRTYFKSTIPEELQEAARMDGCGEWRFLLRVVLPLSLPIMASIGLFYSVSSWNSYFNAMIYITTRDKLPLANILREILVINSSNSPSTSNILMASSDVSGIQRVEMMKYAAIVISSLPLLAIYPFLQRFFIRGVMLGSLKG